MVEDNYGHIVNISSLSHFGGTPNAVVYSATKSAIIGLTYALNKEFLVMSKLRGIKFTAVCPGRMEDTGLGELQLHPWPNTKGMPVSYVANRIIEAISNEEFLVDIPSMRFSAILAL